MRILFSAEKCRRVARRLFFTLCRRFFHRHGFLSHLRSLTMSQKSSLPQPAQRATFSRRLLTGGAARRASAVHNIVCEAGHKNMSSLSCREAALLKVVMSCDPPACALPMCRQRAAAFEERRLTVRSG